MPKGAGGDSDVFAEVFLDFLTGTSVIFLASVLGTLSVFLTRLLLARHLGPENYGLIVLGITFMNIIGFISLLGIPQGIARELPKSKINPKYFIGPSIIAILLAIVLATGGFWALTSFSIFNEPRAESVLLFFAISTPLFVLIKLTGGIFRGQQDVISRSVTENGISQVGLFFAVVVGVWVGFSIPTFAILWPFIYLVSASAGVYLVYSQHLDRKISAATKINVETTKEMLLFSLPLMFSGVAWRLMQQIDNFLIEVIIDTAAVGVYDASYTLASSFALLTTIFGFLALPVLSRLYEQNEQENMDDLYKLVTKWMVFLAAPAVGLTFLFPAEILNLIYGIAYRPGQFAFSIVILGFFIHILVGVNGIALIATGNVHQILIANFTALSANVVLNVILIPKLGIIGAAIASFTSYTLANMYQSFILHKYHSIQPFHFDYIKPLVITFGASGLLRLFWSGVPQKPLLTLITFFGAISVVHVFSITMFGGDSRSELNAIFHVFR